MMTFLESLIIKVIIISSGKNWDIEACRTASMKTLKTMNTSTNYHRLMMIKVKGMTTKSKMIMIESITTLPIGKPIQPVRKLQTNIYRIKEQCDHTMMTVMTQKMTNISPRTLNIEPKLHRTLEIKDKAPVIVVP